MCTCPPQSLERDAARPQCPFGHFGRPERASETRRFGPGPHPPPQPLTRSQPVTGRIRSGDRTSRGRRVRRRSRTPGSSPATISMGMSARRLCRPRDHNPSWSTRSRRGTEDQGAGICRVVVPDSLVTPCGVRHWAAFGWTSVSTASTDAPVNPPAVTVPVNVSTIWPALVVTTPLTESVLCWPLFHLMIVVPGPGFVDAGCSRRRRRCSNPPGPRRL